MKENPFLIHGYKGPEYFCDRQEETANIIDALKNGCNITLISPRRYGKTGLIHNVFHRLKELDKKANCFYVDIYATHSLNDFVQLFAKAVLGHLDTPLQKAENIISKVFRYSQVTMSPDLATGMPQFSLKLCRFITKGFCKANGILHKQHLYSWRSIAELLWFGAKRGLMRLLWNTVNVVCGKGTYYATLIENNGLGFMHRKDNIFPLGTIEFEGKTFSCPNNPDAYLTEQYGDYMQLPPEDKRQIHAVFYKEKLVYEEE